MFHRGARSSGGDLNDPVILEKIEKLLDQFGEVTERRMRDLHLRRAMVRSMLQCNLVIVLDKQNIWVAAQKAVGMPTTLFFDRRVDLYPVNEVLAAAKWEFGFDDPFVVPFPSVLLG